MFVWLLGRSLSEDVAAWVERVHTRRSSLLYGQTAVSGQLGARLARGVQGIALSLAYTCFKLIPLAVRLSSRRWYWVAICLHRGVFIFVRGKMRHVEGSGNRYTLARGF